jgi:hypothetical protein
MARSADEKPPEPTAGAALSSALRTLLLITAVVFVVVGAVLYVAPSWAASRFPLTGSAFAVMTVGSWFLGGAFLAWHSVRDARWPAVYPGIVFLGAFAALEAGVLIMHADDARSSALTWIYVAALAVALGVALAAALERMRIRGKVQPVGRPVPVWVRVITVLFLVFDFYIAVSLLLGTTDGGRIWPGSLPLPMGRAFGAFYLALGLAVAPTLFARRDAPIMWLMPGGVVGAVLILIPALVYLELFDFSAEPGGLIYIGTFLVILVVETIILAVNRQRSR